MDVGATGALGAAHERKGAVHVAGVTWQPSRLACGAASLPRHRDSYTLVS